MNDAASPPDRPATYEDRPDRLWRLSGRIGRARWWWAYQIPAAVLTVPLAFMLDRMAGDDASLGPLLGVVLAALVLWWLMLLGCAKRLRDHAFSAWWVVPMLGLMILGFVLDEFGVLPRISAHTDLINLPVVLVTLVLFGCLRGTRGANRFGPDPLDSPGLGPLLTDEQRRFESRL